MRVAVFNGPGKPITLEHFEYPQPATDELLVKIGRCGICGSDLALTQEGPFCYQPGMTLGHEYAGEVVAFGKAVTDVKIGDRVACMPTGGCGQCDVCKEGRFLMCPSAGRPFGGFGDYVSVPRRAAVLLPRTLSMSDGALVEPMACGLRALRMAGLRGGERILVLGAGSMSLAVIYWARVLGAAQMLVASRSAHRNDILMTMGATAIQGFDDYTPELLTGQYGGLPDIVVECVGKPGMLAKAIEQVRPGGTVISMGMCMHSEPILGALCTFKEIKMMFPLGYSLSEFEKTARTFDADHVDPALMVSDLISLDSLPTTLEDMRNGLKSLKIHVDPGL